MCKKVVCDHVLNVGRRPRSEKKKERVALALVRSGSPMSSPEAVLRGPVPERIWVRWAWGMS